MYHEHPGAYYPKAIARDMLDLVRALNANAREMPSRLPLNQADISADDLLKSCGLSCHQRLTLAPAYERIKTWFEETVGADRDPLIEFVRTLRGNVVMEASTEHYFMGKIEHDRDPDDLAHAVLRFMDLMKDAYRLTSDAPIQNFVILHLDPGEMMGMETECYHSPVKARSAAQAVAFFIARKTGLYPSPPSFMDLRHSIQKVHIECPQEDWDA